MVAPPASSNATVAKKGPAKVPYKVSSAPLKASGGSTGAQFIDAQDLGVKHCALFIDPSAHAEALGRGAREPFLLHVFLRYTVSKGSAAVKGTVSVQLLTPLRESEQGPADVHFNPGVALVTSDNRTTFPVAGNASFPFFPISVAAVTSPLAASFTLMPSRANGAGGAHAYYITAKGANSSCYFDAENEPNVLDVRAHEVDVNDDPAVPPSAAYVVMAPFYDLETPKYEPTPNMERFSVLLDRHIQWHTALGFSKYLVYVRQADVIDFAEQRAVQFWGQRGVLHLVLWSEIQPVPHLPHFDQRVVYTHALLALTGANVYAALLDVDDYVVAPAAQSATAATGAPSGQLPRTFPELVRQCGPPGAVVPANLQLPRFHAAMRGFHRTAAEAEFWTARHTEPTHPLTRYSLVNRKRVSAPKSIVRPEFVHTAGIHTAQGRPGINATSAEPACACVLHLQQLLHPREAYSMTRSAMTRAGYAAEPKLEATLLSHAQTIDLNNVMHILPADHVLSDLGGGWF